MSTPHPTRNFSIRIDQDLFQIGEVLKHRHRSLSHSRIYTEGLKKLIADMTANGEQVPEDPVGVLIELRQCEIDILTAEVGDLQELKKKQQGLNKRPGSIQATDELYQKILAAFKKRVPGGIITKILPENDVNDNLFGISNDVLLAVPELHGDINLLYGAIRQFYKPVITSPAAGVKA